MDSRAVAAVRADVGLIVMSHDLMVRDDGLVQRLYRIPLPNPTGVAPAARPT